MSKQGARILVIDDDVEIVRILKRSLTAHGYLVHTVGSGEEGLEALATFRPDLLLLDLGLPAMSGLEVCQRVRVLSNVPILVLSVKDTERDKVQALDLGADDYVSKPFSIDEVLARIRVILRHLAQIRTGTEPRLHVGPLEFDIARRKVVIDGLEIALTPIEYDLLKVLITHRGKILTRRMLLTQVWGDDAVDKGHSLHVYVGHLRRKIEPIPERPRLLLTIPGVGYRFNDEEDL